MSIHAALSPEALTLLRKQQRISTLASMSIALLLMVLVGLVLAIILIAPFISTQPEVVAYSAPLAQEEAPSRRVVQIPQNRPLAPSANAAKAIASSASSPVSIPVPEVEVEIASEDFGDSMDFGESWGAADVGSAPSESGIGFGSTTVIAGGLRGRLYDFKKDAKGQPVPGFDPTETEPYADRINKIQRARFSDSSFRDFFRAPQELSLTQVAIPLMSATEGPRFFNAEKDIEPRGWLAHYQGRIVSQRDITFRFAGRGDDYLAVYVDGRPRLHGSWPSLYEAVRGRWDPARDAHDKYASGMGASPDTPKLIFGDWIRLRAGQEVRLDIGLGERPGGSVGFILLVEERGEKYESTPEGRPILPLFTTRPFSEESRNEITAAFPNYPFEWENVPIFPAL